MAQYIEEYLIALGFDTDSSQGKEYIKMCEELEKREKSLKNAGQSSSDQIKKTIEIQKSAVNGNKEELDSLKKLSAEKSKNINQLTTEPVAKAEKSNNQSSKTIKQAETPQQESRPQESTSSSQSAKPTTRKTQPYNKVPVKTKQPVNVPISQSSGYKGQNEELNSLGESIKDFSLMWQRIQQGDIFGAFKQGISSVRSFNNYVNNLSGSFNTTDKHATKLKGTLHDMFGGAKETAGEVAEASESAAAAGNSVAGTSAGALGTGAGVLAGIALMTKSVWGMSDGLAQSNINIETMARQLWITNSAAYQLNNTLSAMGKTTSDLNEIAINPTLNKQFQTLQNNQNNWDNTGIEQSSQSWSLGVGTQWELLKQNAGHIGQQVISSFQNYLSSKLLLPMMGINSLFESNTDEQASTTYAPQTYTSSTSNTSGDTNITNHITVNATSGSADDISDAVVQAAQESFANAALTKNVQGLNR